MILASFLRGLELGQSIGCKGRREVREPGVMSLTGAGQHAVYARSRAQCGSRHLLRVEILPVHPDCHCQILTLQPSFERDPSRAGRLRNMSCCGLVDVASIMRSQIDRREIMWIPATVSGQKSVPIGLDRGLIRCCCSCQSATPPHGSIGNASRDGCQCRRSGWHTGLSAD